MRRRLGAFYALVLRRRQNRVVILTEPAPPSPFPPIFVIGCPRSGTSLVRRIVDSHSRIACPPESHFLSPLLGVLDDRRSMVGLESMGFSRATVIDRLRHSAEQFFLDYAAASGKARWADKTPLYVDHLDGLDELFEGSPRYVMLYRHGLDVAQSMVEVIGGFVASLPRVDGDGERGDILTAARYWNDRVNRMLAFQQAHPDRCMALRYEQLNATPEVEVRRLFEFLDEPFEPATLQFNARPHDEGLEDGKVRGSRGFEPHVETYRRWDADTLAAATKEAGPALTALGYDV